MSGDAQLVVTTTSTGDFADDERDQFKNNSNYDVQQNLQKFYAFYFEKIRADSLTNTDDDSTGVFITTEYYTIKDFWTDDKKVKKALFSPFVIASNMKKPDDKIRSMPYSISYPAAYHEQVIINLPEQWDIDTASASITCPAFVFTSKTSYGYKQVRLEYDYKTLKDNIQPAEVDDFVAAVKKADDEDGFKLTYGMGADKDKLRTASTTNKVYMVAAIVLLIGGIVWWTQKRG
jgi:hypothetical protein